MQKTIDFLPFSSNLLWSSPVQILVSLALLWRLVGPASLVSPPTIDVHPRCAIHASNLGVSGTARPASRRS